MDDDIQRLSGSMAITGAADLIMQLKKERGKHFDPKLIDLFMDDLDSFLAIRDSFPD